MLYGHRQVESSVQARQGASGVKSNEGSAAVYSKEMREENQRQRNWTQRSFSTRVQAMKMERNATERYYDTMARNAREYGQEAAHAAIMQGEAAAAPYSIQYHMYDNKLRAANQQNYNIQDDAYVRQTFGYRAGTDAYNREIVKRRQSRR